MFRKLDLFSSKVEEGEDICSVGPFERAISITVLALQRTARCYILEATVLQKYRCENLKCFNFPFGHKIFLTSSCTPQHFVPKHP
jgi:hypothetical protein